MITALDTNILIDVFLPDEIHGATSLLALGAAREAGTVVICDVVYSELVPAFGERSLLDQALRDFSVELSPIDTDIAWEAGQRWTQYRHAGGPRTRILPDFLIGAHALSEADGFLTRDQGFYSTYFPDLGSPPELS